MRILITGGAGFIGSHLCEALLERGDAVICLDNFFTGSHDNIEPLKSNERFTVLEHDITETLSLPCDQIYNLACPASPIHYQHDPIKTVKCNTVGMVNMLELAWRNKARILQASTSEVYGNPQIHPQPASYWGNVNPIGPRACYDEGKRVAETLCMDYHIEKDVDIRIVRIFNTYGPRVAQNDGRVISNFIVQALSGQEITVYGDGSQTRSFQFVSDLIRGLTAMMDQAGLIGPVNLGNPEECSILELAEKVAALIGTKSKIVNKELPKDDPERRRPDITLAREKLRWEPNVKLDEGLPPTIEYFRKKLIR